jgi:hypothetical protein
VRWVLPASGLELYGEWGKGDHSKDLRDLFVEPEHGSGWLLGFQKALRGTPGSQWKVAGELTLLGAPRTTIVRSPQAGFFYVHNLVPQGYTNRGQVLGAGIGPGASQLMLRVDRFTGWGNAGLGVLRTVYDNDRFYHQSPPLDPFGHEVEPTFFADAFVMRGPWDFAATLSASLLMNAHYIPRDDRWNGNLMLSARYHPRLRR